MKQPTSPCSDCPFSRLIKPGTLGGSAPTVYVGQTIGPFLLHCHLAQGYRFKETDGFAVAQCAGAAIFRANIGVADQLPDELHRLPADHDAVFSSHAEMMAHHMECPVEVAEQILERYPPSVWRAKEMHDPLVRTLS